MRQAKGILAAGLFLAVAAFSGAEQLRNHFDSDTLGAPPAYFDFFVLGAPAVAQWQVVGSSNPPSAPNVLVQTVRLRPADSIAAAVRRNSASRDGVWSVFMIRSASTGGIVFRMSGEKDFLVLLMDALSGNARLTAYRDGRPTELAKGRAAITREWGVLKIAASGPKISAQWDDKPLLEATDSAPASGRVGLATAGPGNPSFDEFVLEPAAEKP